MRKKRQFRAAWTLAGRRGYDFVRTSAGERGMAESGRTNGGSLTWNFKLLGHNSLEGFGGMGEGMSMQFAKDGRRILWLAHESAPKNFTAGDVSDPRELKIVARARCRMRRCAPIRSKRLATSSRSPIRPRSPDGSPGAA